MIGGKDVTTGKSEAGGDAARQGARPRRRAPGRRRACRAGDRRGGGGVGGVVEVVVGGPRRGPAARGGAARGPVARHAERRDDARAVEDGAPGGDRRGVRVDRLLALQRRVHVPDLRRAADVVARNLEPARVPAARGLRVRGLAVQLHGDRREPHELACADGEHGRLEARRNGDALRVLPDAPLPGGRAAGRRDQPRLWRGRDDRRRSAREPAPLRHPLHRLDSRVQRDVADRRRRDGALPELPAHRRRDRRQGLHRGAPVRRPRLARCRDRPRLVRVPGPEVLGRRRGSTRPRTSGRSCASGCRRRSRRSRSATSPTSATSWAR